MTRDNVILLAPNVDTCMQQKMFEIDGSAVSGQVSKPNQTARLQLLLNVRLPWSWIENSAGTWLLRWILAVVPGVVFWAILPLRRSGRARYLFKRKHLFTPRKSGESLQAKNYSGGDKTLHARETLLEWTILRFLVWRDRFVTHSWQVFVWKCEVLCHA